MVQNLVWAGKDSPTLHFAILATFARARRRSFPHRAETAPYGSQTISSIRILQSVVSWGFSFCSTELSLGREGSPTLRFAILATLARARRRSFPHRAETAPYGSQTISSIRILQLVVSWGFSFCGTELSLGREGFEPSKVKPADLQSALVGHLSTYPKKLHGAA